jgi:multidrug efflux pump subunit AcrB
MINMDQNLMQAKNVSPNDVLNSVNAQNLILPSGTSKIAESELDVRVNVKPRTVTELGDLPSKQVGAKTIYLKDVARVSEGFALQTNVVRQDGHRGGWSACSRPELHRLWIREVLMNHNPCGLSTEPAAEAIRS